MYNDELLNATENNENKPDVPVSDTQSFTSDAGQEQAPRETKDILFSERSTSSDSYTGSFGYYPWQYRTPAPSASPVPEPKRRSPKKFFEVVAFALCFGLIAGLCFFGVNKGMGTLLSDEDTSLGIDSLYQGNATAGKIQTTSLSAVGDMAYSPAVSVVEENLPASVIITCTVKSTVRYFGQLYEEEYTTGGTGIIVGKNDTELLIATNNHVINNASSITVTPIDETPYSATVKGTDSVADLAIIAISLSDMSEETLNAIKIAKLGNSDEVKMGEMAVAIGNALGFGQSVTVGYISAKDRTVSVDGTDMVLLQTSAAINEGNSGGGLFNINGEVIGINSVKYSDTSVEGVCFAIPISRAIPILESLMSRQTLAEEDKGYLGVRIETVTDTYASYFGWPYGVYVNLVYEGGAANLAGIYSGDIIVGVGNVSVKTDDELVKAVTSYPAGADVVLNVKRLTNGEWVEQAITVTLQSYEEAFAAMQGVEE